MTDTPYFVIDDLTIGYHKVPVIRDISVKVQKGEIIALIGPNGAGKSTLLKTIARDLEPIRGKIFLEGRDMQTITYRELSKKLAVILTERIKVELTTCRDVVATGRYPYTGRLGVLRGEDQRIVDEAMETVHALELAERDFNAISDGQRQRVLLARAIAQQPEMILLDEPTSFLDVRHKLDLLTILTRMARKKNITVIMSLHEIDLAEKVADRILTVKGDTQFGFGAPGEVFEEQAIRKLYDIEDGYFDQKACRRHAGGVRARGRGDGHIRVPEAPARERPVCDRRAVRKRCGLPACAAARRGNGLRAGVRRAGRCRIRKSI